MNLKRLRGIAAVALATIAAALIAGCSNSLAGSIDEGAAGNSNARMATLSLSATGIPNDYAEQFARSYPTAAKAAARSITPNDPYDIGGIGTGEGKQSDDLTLVLTGKSETGKIYKDENGNIGKEVTLTETSAGSGVYDFTTPITMDSMSWNLVLTAYKSYTAGASTNTPVLQGFCSVDLRNGSGTATFVMGIAGLTTPGKVTLGGTIVDTSDAAKSYKMGIYRKDNGKDVASTEDTSGTLTVNNGADESFDFSAASVPPGTYLYTMIFYNGSSCSGDIVGSFTDTIVIDPGNELNQSGIVVDVIGKKPTEPKDLKAYIVDGKQSPDGRTYNVKVTWTQSKYVTNYELNVVEYDENNVNGDDIDAYFAPDATTKLIKNGQIYGMASMDKTTPTKIVEDFPGSDVFGTGSSSMMYGDESCVLKLDTGKVYEIQLRARNYIGVSDWVNRDAGDTGVTGFTAYAVPTAQRINCLLITYDLNGGLLTINNSPKTGELLYTEYKCWTTNAPLMSIVDADSATTNTLKKIFGTNTNYWNAWLLADGTAVEDFGNAPTVTTTAVGTKVTGYTYKNVTVMASFGNEVTASISQEPKKVDLEVSDIKVTYEGTDVTLTNNSVAINRNGSNGVIKIDLSTPVSGYIYKNIKVEVKRQSDTRYENIQPSGTAIYNISTDNYSSGKIYVMVTADTDNATSRSQTLIFELE